MIQAFGSVMAKSQACSGVPRTRLSNRSEADPAVFAAAVLAARKLRERTSCTAASAALRAPTDDGATGLAPSAERLAQVAEAAQEAMIGITARTVCAVCCCTVQEASTVPVVVTEEPPTAWHAKLKATPAMALHAELRAQCTIGDDAADVHPLWTDMHGNLVVDWTAASARRNAPSRAPRPALTFALSCLRLCFRLLCPASLYDSGSGEWSVDVCKTCKSSLDGTRTGTPPKRSIANGNFRGHASSVPELADLPQSVSCRDLAACRTARLPCPTTGATR